MATGALVELDLVFEEYFDELYRRAYGVAYQLLGVRTEAEDVAQEALARAYVRWDKVRDHAAPWIVRTSSNLAIGTWRKRRHVVPADGDDDESTTPGPDGRRVDLHRALRTLSKRQREVVVLRYLADCSEADVATLLGCSPGSVKQHASRGLAALRIELGDELHDDRHEGIEVT